MMSYKVINQKYFIPEHFTAWYTIWAKYIIFTIPAAKDDGLVEIPLESYAPVNAQKIRVNQETADIESCNRK